MERVEEVLAAVGLTEAADRRVKGYSMGMRQRLAIAAALLGDPEVLILDEPTNGLDPPGISWMRRLLREQAANGRAVLVSSHLLAEVAQSVDDVVIIANGEMRGRGTLEEVLGGDEGDVTEVRAQDPERLASALERARAPGRARGRRPARARDEPGGRRRGRARGAGGADRPRAAQALARDGFLRAHRAASSEAAAARRVAQAPHDADVRHARLRHARAVAGGGRPDRDPRRRLHRAT